MQLHLGSASGILNSVTTCPKFTCHTIFLRCRLVTVSGTVWDNTYLVPLRILKVSRKGTVTMLSLTGTRALLSILQDLLELLVRAK